MTIAVITGGRDHTPSRFELEDMLGVLTERSASVVRTGGARGVDTIVYEWLQTYKVQPRSRLCAGDLPPLERIERWAPDWLRYHNAAGTMRNVAMLTGNVGTGSGIRRDQSIISTAGQPATLLVAFPGGTGTMRCCEAALARDIEIHYVTRRPSA